MLNFWIRKLCVLDVDVISGGKKLESSRCDREGNTCILVPLSYGICEISRGIFLMLVSGLIYLSETQKSHLGWIIYWIYIEAILACKR